MNSKGKKKFIYIVAMVWTPLAFAGEVEQAFERYYQQSISRLYAEHPEAKMFSNVIEEAQLFASMPVSSDGKRKLRPGESERQARNQIDPMGNTNFESWLKLDPNLRKKYGRLSQWFEEEPPPGAKKKEDKSKSAFLIWAQYKREQASAAMNRLLRTFYLEFLTMGAKVTFDSKQTGPIEITTKNIIDFSTSDGLRTLYKGKDYGELIKIEFAGAKFEPFGIPTIAEAPMELFSQGYKSNERGIQKKAAYIDQVRFRLKMLSILHRTLFSPDLESFIQQYKDTFGTAEIETEIAPREKVAKAIGSYTLSYQSEKAHLTPRKKKLRAIFRVNTSSRHYHLYEGELKRLERLKLEQHKEGPLKVETTLYLENSKGLIAIPRPVGSDLASLTVHSDEGAVLEEGTDYSIHKQLGGDTLIIKLNKPGLKIGFSATFSEKDIQEKDQPLLFLQPEKLKVVGKKLKSGGLKKMGELLMRAVSGGKSITIKDLEKIIESGSNYVEKPINAKQGRGAYGEFGTCVDDRGDFRHNCSGVTDLFSRILQDYLREDALSKANTALSVHQITGFLPHQTKEGELVLSDEMHAWLRADHKGSSYLLDATPPLRGGQLEKQIIEAHETTQSRLQKTKASGGWWNLFVEGRNISSDKLRRKLAQLNQLFSSHSGENLHRQKHPLLEITALLKLLYHLQKDKNTKRAVSIFSHWNADKSDGRSAVKMLEFIRDRTEELFRVGDEKFLKELIRTLPSNFNPSDYFLLLSFLKGEVTQLLSEIKSAKSEHLETLPSECRYYFSP